MSIHINWVAVERTDPGLLLEALGMQEIGAANDARQAAYAYTMTPKGWLVLVGASMRLKFERLLAPLSAAQPILAGEVSDIVMFSRLQAWQAGGHLWSVTHDPEGGIEDLKIAGEPPGELVEIERRLAARQAEAQVAVDHMFDAPLELGELICGFRPDQPLAGPWILLAPAESRHGPVASSLPAAIRAELLPALAGLGWTVAPIRLLANGRAYDASRIRRGRLETVRFLWRDDRRDVAIIPNFAMLEGDHPDGGVVVSGGLHRRPASSLVQRIRSWRPGRPVKTYEEKVRDAVAETRADLADFDRTIDDAAAAVSG